MHNEVCYLKTQKSSIKYNLNVCGVQTGKRYINVRNL